jgi:hypothetical protein
MNINKTKKPSKPLVLKFLKVVMLLVNLIGFIKTEVIVWTGVKNEVVWDIGIKIC